MYAVISLQWHSDFHSYFIVGVYMYYMCMNGFGMLCLSIGVELVLFPGTCHLQIS